MCVQATDTIHSKYIRAMNKVKNALCGCSSFEIQNEGVKGESIGSSSSLCLRVWACKALIMRDSGEDSFCKVRQYKLFTAPR